MIALEEALQIVSDAEAWNVNDDLCDCPNQRTFGIFNPHHGVKEEIRLCCLFAELRKYWPQHFRTTVEPATDWVGESDMPRSIWHRHLANRLGVSVSEARGLNLEPPKGKPLPEKVSIYLPVGGNEYAEFVLG